MIVVAVGVAQYLACIVDNIAMLLPISHILEIPCFDRTCRRSSLRRVASVSDETPGALEESHVWRNV